MEKNQENNIDNNIIKCIDHGNQCLYFCKDERCMYPLLCSICEELHKKEYKNKESHELLPILNLFENEEQKLEFIKEYNSDMDKIDSQTQEKKEILKGAYNEFTYEILSTCHKYFINNNISNVVENLKDEFEMSKGEYQNEMTTETLKQMAESYMKLQKVDQILKEKPNFLLSKEQLFENIENELENLDGMIKAKFLKLKENYISQLSSVVDYDITTHFDKLLAEELKRENELSKNISEYESNRIQPEE